MLALLLAMLLVPLAQAGPIETSDNAQGHPVVVSGTGDATCSGMAGCLVVSGTGSADCYTPAGCVVVAGSSASCPGYCVALAGGTADCAFTCVAVAGDDVHAAVAAVVDLAACVVSQCLLPEEINERRCLPLLSLACVTVGTNGVAACTNQACASSNGSGAKACVYSDCTEITPESAPGMVQDALAAATGTAQQELDDLRNWETTCTYVVCVRGSGPTQAFLVAVGPGATAPVAVATTGNANGEPVAVSTGGQAFGLVALGAQGCNGQPCYGVGPHAQADYLAVGTGYTNSRGVAVGGSGANGAVAFSPTGDTNGLVAASLTGDASCGSTCVVATVTGDTHCAGYCVDASGRGAVATVIGAPAYGRQVTENTLDLVFLFVNAAHRNAERFIEDNTPP